MKQLFSILLILVAAAMATSGQIPVSDEGGRVLALETAWGHAIELKDTKALDQMLASTFVAVEIDGTLSNKTEFLAGIRAPEYQPSQAVNEQINVQVYGNAAVVAESFASRAPKRARPTFIANGSLTLGSSRIRLGNASPAPPRSSQ